MFSDNYYKIDSIASLPPSVGLHKMCNLFLLAASENDLFTIDKAVNKIKYLVVISNSFDKEDIIKIKRILISISYNITHCPVFWAKYNRFQELYTDLIEVLEKNKNIGTLRQILEKLGFEIYDTYMDGINNYNQESLNALRDFYKKFISFDIKVKNEKPQLYDRYKKVVASFSSVLSKLPLLQMVEKNNKKVFYKESITVISKEFSDFYKDFSDFLLGFEEPDEKVENLRDDINTKKA